MDMGICGDMSDNLCGYGDIYVDMGDIYVDMGDFMPIWRYFMQIWGYLHKYEDIKSINGW